jgi:cytochrome o ubiquinol oxidase operon protein cyoD
MSADHELEHGHAAHDDHDDDHAEGGHGTLRDYTIGFLLSAVLTAIPFWLVMSGGVGSSGMTALVILAFAAVQIVVHMVYFLHMNTKSEQGWSILALIFTLVLVVIMLAGSLWVMYHLNTNMMPMSPHDMRNMP